MLNGTKLTIKPKNRITKILINGWLTLDRFSSTLFTQKTKLDDL